MSSYPYLEIARITGADYGDVLSYADAIEESWGDAQVDYGPDISTYWRRLAATRLANWEKKEIHHAHADEQARRYKVK